MVRKEPPVNVTLAPELEQFIQAVVASGQYPSATDVIEAAVRLLRQQVSAPAARTEPLHARVDDALVALTRGDGVEGESYVEDPKGRLETSQEEERPLPR
jgi:antitoxin ParD1/3/4